MNKKYSKSIIAAIFTFIVVFIATSPLFTPLLIPYFPPEECEVHLSDQEIRDVVINEIHESGLNLFFSRNAAGLKAEDGIWEIKKHEMPNNPESEYETNKYEVNFTHPDQFITVFIGLCGGINMIFNKPYESYKYRVPDFYISR